MKTNIPRTVVGRSLLVLVLSIGLLALTLIVVLRLTSQNSQAHSPAPTVTTQAGPYTLAVSVSPDPPPINQAAHLVLRVTDTITGQLVTDAGVEIRGVMQSMDMLMGPIYADSQADGTYLADVKFSMTGSWLLSVTITRSNASPASTQFRLTSG